MAELLPWLALAGFGVLHGLSPAGGWLWAAGWSVQARDAAQVRRTLAPLALGHAAAVAAAAWAFTQNLAWDRARLQCVAGVLLLVAAAHCLSRGRVPLPRSALAAWSFLMALAHGAGLALVPALAPLCVGIAPGSAQTGTGLLAWALIAVAVHLAALLATTWLVATGASRWLLARPALARHAAWRWLSAAGIAGLGVLLLSGA